MNERIQELAKQSTDDILGVKILDQKKFAQLIVQECADISKQSQWSEAKGEYYEGFNEAIIYVSNKIKQHFGVE